MTNLLTAEDGSIAQALAPVTTVLTEADNPYQVLAWLKRSPAAQLLGHLARQPGDLSHEALDALGPQAATAYVRGLLVTAGILPKRDENLALLTNWLARTLAGIPSHHVTLIRPFAEWQVIRDARRRSARGRYTFNAHKGDCGNIRAAIQFLAWLDARRLTLATLEQGHLDTWSTDRPGVRTRSIPFIRWAAARRLIADLTIDHPPSQLPGAFQVEDIHREELRRCLDDISLPLEVRITGALIRLYALPLTRIVELTADQFHRDDKKAYLTINRHPVVLPPKLARLIEDQLREATTLHRQPQETERFLLPGQIPGRPRNPVGLGDTMKRHSLPARAARNTAMMEALADLPPIVISDLVGISPVTAHRWARLAGDNWSDYLATRQPAQRR
ncbi:hypothetical protein ACWD0J_34415 [Streptomyces sp. NPDC003011]